MATCLLGGAAFAQTVSGQITVNGVVQGTAQTGSTISDSITQTAAKAAYTGNAATGVFNVVAAHSGAPGSTLTELTYTNTITNTLATAQNVSFSFFIFSGAINSRKGLDTSGATFASAIDWSGQSLWSTQLAITTGRFYIPDAPTAVVSNSASASDFVYSTSYSATSSNTYVGSWGDYAKTIGLGILNPGESKTLTYTMSALSYSGNNNFAGYGGAAGFAGDPLSFDFSPVPTAGVPVGVTLAAVTAVPEPSTYAMLLLGMTVLGAATRRRRTKAKANQSINEKLALAS